MHLAPAGVHIDALLGVRERLVVFFQAAVARRGVAVKHVRRAKLDGLAEVSDCLLIISSLELSVAELLLCVSHL